MNGYEISPFAEYASREDWVEVFVEAMGRYDLRFEEWEANLIDETSSGD